MVGGGQESSLPHILSVDIPGAEGLDFFTFAPMSDLLLHVAIPLMQEADNLPALLACIDSQQYKNYRVYCCVNHPESYRSNAEYRAVVEDNERTLELLKSRNDFTLIDRASEGKGWQGKRRGVGMARKILMDHISTIASADDVLLSLDGDTLFEQNYFGALVEAFVQKPQMPALSVPYYHRLTGREEEDRAILRYEIYMRNYATNMHRIKSPYAYTALGSAMACRLGAYRAIGGMTPKKSGEDFYFLQKMVKYRGLGVWCGTRVFPAARFSSRVEFGTGPAMIKGRQGNWNSYPVYHHSLFDRVGSFYHQFSELFYRHVDNLGDALFGIGWEEPLRANASDEQQFVRFCHTKFDGLRILQYLKSAHRQRPMGDEMALQSLFELHGQQPLVNLHSLSFEAMSIPQLDSLRQQLLHIEKQFLQAAAQENPWMF